MAWIQWFLNTVSNLVNEFLSSKTFKIGAELIEVFKASGFREITERRFPEDFRKFQCESFHPLIHRRAFAKGRCCILILDRCELIFHDEWSPVAGIKKSLLTREEVISLLVFSWLTRHQRRQLRKKFDPFNINTHSTHFHSLFSRNSAIRELLKAMDNA